MTQWFRSLLNGWYARRYTAALARPDVRGVLNACSALPATSYWRGAERLWLDDIRANANGVRIAAKFGWIERSPVQVLRRTDWYVRLTPSGRNAYEDMLKVDEVEHEKAMRARQSFADAPPTDLAKDLAHAE